jgi:glutaconyl-CoA/methylmalonyl-CoA decarboxylase subunit gamma
MKKYRVKVNGKLYEVELEACDEVKGSIEAPKASAPVSTPVASNGEETPLLAPIGGKVLDVKVSVGSSVKKGDVVCVIEAMKLENEIKANADGVIKEIKASKGSMVQNKDVLLIIG